MIDPLFSDDYKLASYWLDDAPLAVLPTSELPSEVDVAIVGAGYTGLVAALTVARAGRGVVVFDAEDAGFGCSTRNGGQCGAGFKNGFDDLAKTYGKPRAVALYKEALASLDFLTSFVAGEDIACDYKHCGRFMGAHAPGHYEDMARKFETNRRELGIECYMVPRAEQHSEIDSDAYYGGGVMPSHTSLHPAKYHAGLLERALAAGAVVHPHTAVTHIEREGSGFMVTTARGRLRAGQVIVATNGYSNNVGSLPDLSRRVIPIGSYMIATEPLAPGVIDRLMPKDRVTSDTRRVVLYYRASPDRTRILFGGRVALAETDPAISGPRLHAVLCEIFPEIATVGISHSWMGFVGYTFDKMPHLGVRGGLHYAMGYCGSGVAMGSYLGHKIAHKLLGNEEGDTAFDELPFQTRPLYFGKPWFLAAAVAWYKFLDRRAR
jgi:glycine/D-amino acid oxidase-like deaminating enzyme